MNGKAAVKNPYITRLVQAILEWPLTHKWSLQGFGMLRVQLPGAMRLNVWDKTFAAPGIDKSSVHTHPWHFDSYVVCGVLKNRRYKVGAYGEGMVFNEQEIVTGPGGRVLGRPQQVWLWYKEDEFYRAGDVYHQDADEIHWSLPERGTVTLNDRVRLPTDIAKVYWRGSAWVTAEPRQATDAEVTAAASFALDLLKEENQ